MTSEQINKMQAGRSKAEKLPSRVKAMKIKCLECTNFFADGRTDCGITTCPLYPWMPYRKQPYNEWWVKTKVKDLRDMYRRAIRLLTE